MAQPAFMPEGQTPELNDTQIRAWKKILGFYCDAFGLPAAMRPRIDDTLKITKTKVEAACLGASVSFYG